MTINVFIVDDSATARTALRLILEDSDDVNVIGVASTPLIALKRMVKRWPDVIISDIEMPGMNGFEFLEYLQRNRPTPFIVFSNCMGSSATSSVEALSQGAVDIIAKPDFNRDSLDEIQALVLNSIKAAANLSLSKAGSSELKRSEPKKLTPIKELVNVASAVVGRRMEQSAEVVLDDLPELKRQRMGVIAIGSSTGGTTIIEKFLRQLTPSCPGVVIVQHMPEHFTRAFATRVNQFCEITVKEAEDGDAIEPGVALIAPGGRHMEVKLTRSAYHISLNDDEFVNRHRPSVDVLFNSVAEYVREDAMGVILTGMGKDGAKGLLAMRRNGAVTVSQSEDDCAVYGMPKAAMAIDAVDYELSSGQITALLKQLKYR